MNKHIIFFSVLLASAVSLHTLSYNLNDSPKIVKTEFTPVNSEQIKIEKEKIPLKMAVKLTPETKIKKIMIKVGSGKEKVKITEVKKVPVKTKIQKKPIEIATIKTEEVKTIPDKPTQTNIKLAYALIPSKNYNDIVKEAKFIGGRVDPFLSMKPPELEKLPEIPFTKHETVTVKEPVPVNNIQQEFPTNENTKTVPKVNTKEPVKLAQKPETILVKLPRKLVKPDTKNIIEYYPNIQEGLILTGIITGNKPLALVSVDNKNKVYGMGDVLRENKNIRIVSIDFDTQAITISDDKNRKARISIQ